VTVSGRQIFPAGQTEARPDGGHGGAGLRDCIRRTLTGYYHPVGSCALGTGPDAVADLQLRVHGVAGLRVADASVFPEIPNANTHATVLAVAERAAELVAAAPS